jgi:hypothetical protein
VKGKDATKFKKNIVQIETRTRQDVSKTNNKSVGAFTV